jgi:4-carboxymuconolactone decarboxylase
VTETPRDARERSSYDEGMDVRRSVLGASYVEASLERAGEFAEPLQRMVTEVVWGSIWTRPGLDHRTRSLLNLAMLSAMGQLHELAAHTRGAVRNGCTPSEIREVLLQVMAYCGAPAALAAMRVVQQVLEDLSGEAESN